MMARLGDTVAAMKRLKEMAAAGDMAMASSMPASAGMRETVAFAPNPGGLRMLSHVPEGARALVVVLHGCTQTAEGYAAGSGWLALADRYGFAVLAPEQTTANNPQRCFNWFQAGDTRRGAGEAASIAAMIATMTAEHGLDPARVYVTGLSAGGAMTSAMLAGYPELFAGGGIVAGLPHGAAGSMPEAFEAMMQGGSRSGAAWGDEVRRASPHTGRWPTVSVWHGGADRTVTPANADAIVGQWLNVHGLTSAPDQSSSGPGWTRQAWTDASGATVVELYRLPALGHGTPLAAGGVDGVGAAGPFLLEAGVSSSLEMAKAWGLTGATRPVAERRGQESAPAPGLWTAPKEERVDATFVAEPEPARMDVASVINRALAAAGLLK